MAVCTGECRGRKVLTFLFDFSLTFLVRLCKKNGDRVQIMMAAPPKPASTDKRERQGCTSVSYQYKTNAHHQFGLLGIKTRGKMLMEGAELFTHMTYIVEESSICKSQHFFFLKRRTSPATESERCMRPLY